MSQKGAFLLETLLVVSLAAATLLSAHLMLIKHWRKKLDALQERRLPYDGEAAWKQRVHGLGSQV